MPAGSKRQATITAIFLALAVSASAAEPAPLPAQLASSPEDGRPNVIVVVSDDHGYGDLGFTGNPVIKTPHLDQFAREGIRLDNFHVNPVCSPNRHPKALPNIVGVRLKVGDTVLEKPVPKDAIMVGFTLPAKAGPSTISATFLDKNGKTVCGAYYLYAARAPKTNKQRPSTARTAPSGSPRGV